MNFELLFSPPSPTQAAQSVRYALTGAKGGFARTLLAQTRLIDRLVPAALCDLDVAGLRAMCVELGFDEASLVECADAASVGSLAPGQIALVADVASAIAGCAAWHATPEVRLAKCAPRALKKRLQAALRARKY